jgi:DNA-binding FadR family transcriptional regulator
MVGALLQYAYDGRRMDHGQSALTQLKAYLAQLNLPEHARLPAERELCEVLGVSRGELRKALALLEAEGEVWRHVGKGTFLGARPPEELSIIADVASRSNPAEVMRARLLVEPLLAGEAALHATGEGIAEMHLCLSGARRAETWRQYENWDNRLHRAVAESADNLVLLALFDSLNAIRRTVVWGRLRQGPERPPVDHHSFSDHDAIVAAIENRDGEAAARTMRRHLNTVHRRLISVHKTIG